jgi:hypothetical protein
VPAARASKPLGPAKLEQIFDACFFSAKPPFKLKQCFWIVFHGRLSYTVALGESTRDPNKEIAEGTTLGRVLGSGAAVTGRVYGMRRVPTVKDQAMAVQERCGIKGMNVTYAKSPMGADHTTAATYRA